MRMPTYDLATASAHNCAVWAVWREGARLAILGTKSLSSGCLTPRFGAWNSAATDTRMTPVAKLVDVASIGSYFESLSDPRHARNRKHLLGDIAVIAVCGILCGGDGPTAIHRWAKHRASWLAQYLALPNGIPSRDCIRRLLVVLKPEAFQRCFRDWISDAIT